jgi:hypothetical protein
MFAVSKWGHPLKGLSREKTPLLSKKCPHFFHWPQRVHQYDIISIHPLRARFFCLVGCMSACLRPRADADPHQSPIRIKAFVLYAQCLKHGPCPPRLYGPRKSSVPCRVQLDVLQILWFLANPFVAHDIGESGRKNDYRPRQRFLCRCSSYQSNLVDSIPTPIPAHCCTQTD